MANVEMLKEVSDLTKDIVKLEAQVEFQNKQIILLIKTVHKLMDATKTLDTDFERLNDPFDEVFAGVSELEFNHGIEE